MSKIKTVELEGDLEFTYGYRPNVAWVDVCFGDRAFFDSSIDGGVATLTADDCRYFALLFTTMARKLDRMGAKIERMGSGY